MSYSYMFYIVLLWIAFFIVSVFITVLFDWYYPVGKSNGLVYWRHWWHALLMLLLTFLTGIMFGFGLTGLQILGVPPGPDRIWASSIGLMILWSITFTVIHVLWLNWQVRSLK